MKRFMNFLKVVGFFVLLIGLCAGTELFLDSHKDLIEPVAIGSCIFGFLFFAWLISADRHKKPSKQKSCKCRCHCHDEVPM
jgi:Ca2+/Na+ antiporter